GDNRPDHRRSVACPHRATVAGDHRLRHGPDAGTLAHLEHHPIGVGGRDDDRFFFVKNDLVHAAISVLSPFGVLSLGRKRGSGSCASRITILPSFRRGVGGETHRPSLSRTAPGPPFLKGGNVFIRKRDEAARRACWSSATVSLHEPTH